MASEEETQQGDSGDHKDISKEISNAPGTNEEATKKARDSLSEIEEQTDDGQTDLTGEF
jgi:hypothetical protein